MNSKQWLCGPAEVPITTRKTSERKTAAAVIEQTTELCVLYYPHVTIYLLCTSTVVLSHYFIVHPDFNAEVFTCPSHALNTLTSGSGIAISSHH